MIKRLKNIKCAYFLAFLFGLFPALLFAQEDLLEHQQIESLEVTVDDCSDGEFTSIINTIKARLKTRQGDLFSQAAFDADLKMLAQDYDRVEPHVTSKDGNVSISVNVWRKPHIRRICWQGNEKLKTSRLLSELDVRPGAVFDRLAFNRAFNKVKAYYVKKGFFEARLDYAVAYDPPCNQVDITITVEEGRAGKVSQVVFCNFTPCEQEELAEIILTKKYNMFLSWYTGEGIYHEDMVQHDKFIILNYLQNHGYADARVEIDVRESQRKNRIIIYVTTDKGPRYSFGEITLSGNTLYSEEQLRECLKIQTGCPFSPEKIHESMTQMTNLYGRNGYIEAVINYEPKLAGDACVYDVHFTIEEGEKYCVGLIKVMGNCSTQTKVILHETLLIPGEVFNLEKLQVTEQRLCNIGYFKNVNVYAVKTEAESLLPENYRDVHIEVEETNTGNLGAFFGFSSVENMFGGVNLTERNFNIAGLGRVRRDGLSALRGGGEYAHITLSIGRKSNNYIMSWTKPYFMDTPWAVGVDIDRTYNEYISDDYEIKATGLNLHAMYECNPFLRVGTHYRLRYTDIHVSDDASRKAKKEAQGAGLISALGLSWLYDSSNHPIKPSRGLKSRIEGEIAGLGGDFAFLSVGYLNSYFFSGWGKDVIKLRADFRFLQPLGSTNGDDLPLDERFFLGGDYTVRGYRSYRLGPKFDDDDEDPRGGISMQLFSIEYVKPIFPRFDLFFFVDVGSLSSKKWAFGRYYSSIGYGANISILGNGPPLTVGMGYPLSHAHHSDVKKFFISVGGKF